ncbi:MAG: acetyl-CoA hydrolase/transferase C-terminal domain-containing protein [Myxococcales bacterium]
MSEILDRIENPYLAQKIMPAEEAAKLIFDHATLAISGFTKSGEPKTFMPALAKHLSENAPTTRISLFSGASLSEDVEAPIAPFVSRRGPYMSSPASRKLIHAGRMDFADIHLSQFARSLAYGIYGDIDYAVVEVCKIWRDGTAILTSSVGNTTEALAKARHIILEVNTAQPDFTGFHDLLVPTVHPRVCWPLPITSVKDRIGTVNARFDMRKVVAVVESNIPDYPVSFKPTSEVDRRIAGNVIQFLLHCRDWLGWKDSLPPIQSGVGNVANAVIGELYNSPFRKIRFWTEVFQDGMIKYVEDDDKFDCASATAISLSQDGRTEFMRLFDRCRDKIVLRPMWISNSAEPITRLYVIAMNTPLEIDIFGNCNSTHVDGTKLINGLGGSGDFLRNAYLSLMHTPSTRALRDGRVVSCIVPSLRHVDHTEHDVKCVVTEHGFALNMDIRSPKRRAADIIEKCAHPYFRPLLREYVKMSGEGDEPHPSDMRFVEGWMREYDEATRAFPIDRPVRVTAPE